LLFVAHAQAEPMTLDGRLVEAAWDQAVRLEDFVTVMPLTREMPEVRTQAWVLRRKKGCTLDSDVSSPLRCRVRGIRPRATCKRARTDSM